MTEPRKPQGMPSQPHSSMPPRSMPAAQQPSPQRAPIPQPAPRTSRSDRLHARKKKKAPLKALLWLAVPLALLLVLISLRISSAGTQAQIISLHEQRAAAEAEHQRLIGYYVSMRRNSGVYDLIKKYAAEYQVDPSFVSAIIARESHYEPYAESKVGARGLMQIMEGTGTWIAQRLGFNDYQYEHLYDPDLNIRFGTWYLAQLSSQFAGNPVMTSAAYHAGADNVKLWALRLAEDKKTILLPQIPMPDTLSYVTKVMDAYALYHEYDVSRK